jgi:hypothetical protein
MYFHHFLENDVELRKISVKRKNKLSLSESEPYFYIHSGIPISDDKKNRTTNLIGKRHTHTLTFKHWSVHSAPVYIIC